MKDISSQQSMTSGKSVFFSPSKYGGINNPYKPDNALGSKPIGNEWIQESDKNHLHNTQIHLDDWLEKTKLLQGKEIIVYTKKYMRDLVQQERKGLITKRTCYVVIKQLQKEIEKHTRQDEIKKIISAIEKHAKNINVNTLIKKIKFTYGSSVIEKIKFGFGNSISSEQYDATKDIVKHALGLAAKRNPLVALALEECSKSFEGVPINISDAMSSNEEGQYQFFYRRIKVRSMPKIDDPYTYQLVIERYADLVGHELIHLWMADKNGKIRSQSASWLPLVMSDAWYAVLQGWSLSDEYALQSTLFVVPINPRLSERNRAKEMKRLEKLLKQGEKKTHSSEMKTLICQTHIPKIMTFLIRSDSSEAKTLTSMLSKQLMFEPVEIEQNGQKIFVFKIIPNVDGKNDQVLYAHTRSPFLQGCPREGDNMVPIEPTMKDMLMKNFILSFEKDVKQMHEDSESTGDNHYKNNSEGAKYEAIMEKFTRVIAQYSWDIVKTAFPDLLWRMFKKGYLPSAEALGLEQKIGTCENLSYVKRTKPKF